MSKAIFELKDVHFSYLGKFPALCGINIDICAGESIAVIGANGSGKSTLLHLLDGLIFPTKGNIKAFDRRLQEDVFNDAEFSRFFRSRVGLVFQSYDAQLFCPTVKEDIVFGPLQFGMGKQEIKAKLESIAAQLKINHLLERPPHQLSIGEKHRVALASVLVYSPEVLLLDEPTAGLDPRTIRELIGLLLDYHSTGKTIIMATHDLHIVEELSDTVYVFSEEKTVAGVGPTQSILSDKALLERYNLLHIHAHRHKDAVHTHVHLHQHSEHHGGI